METSNNNSLFIVSIVVAAILGWFFVWPKIGETRALVSARTTEQLDLEVVRETGASIRDAATFYEGLSFEEKELVQRAAPEHSNRHDIASIVDELARSHGMVLVTVDVPEASEAAVGAEKLDQVEVSMTLEGSYDAYINFLAGIEKTLRIFSPRSIVVLPPGNEASGQVYRITLGGVMYYRGERASNAAPTTGGTVEEDSAGFQPQNVSPIR
ncbi:MAG: hypothetical protein WD850_01625 [Candidatus Spechtbacterales bacterium]